jgi:hypothetical protein
MSEINEKKKRSKFLRNKLKPLQEKIVSQQLSSLLKVKKENNEKHKNMLFTACLDIPLKVCPSRPPNTD